MVPSEDKMAYEAFLDNDVVHGEVERNLGGDALHMTIGHMTNDSWLPRLPMNAINNITSHLALSDVGNLHKVCMSIVIILSCKEKFSKIILLLKTL